ncbi:transposable element Tcb2 transposase [Trichonephila clavipes]|nr:transposable element Tcb2 transposase [Trichonephila clavipes]
MGRRNHLDDFTRGRTIGKLEEGRTVTSVAAELRINKSVVSRACGAESTETRQLTNEVVSSLWMRVDSVPEVILNVMIWREIGTRYYPSNTKERHRYGGFGVPVWGGIMLNGRTKLHILDRSSVTGDSYCDEVLLPHVRLFRGAIGPDFIFMDANARPHRTLAIEELLESEDITRMDWSAYSLDLNLIEHVWDALGRRIAARLHHPENT